VIVPAAEVVAVLAAVALIRTLQVKAFESIQLAPTLAAIAGEGRSIIDDLYRGPYMPDPLFVFRLLADIGLRALSPAINDPATATQVLDTIESLLGPLVSRDLDVAEVCDSSGAVRVVLSLPSWDDYLRTAGVTRPAAKPDEFQPSCCFLLFPGGAPGPGEGKRLVAQPCPVHGRPRLGDAGPVARNANPQREGPDGAVHGCGHQH
jgi:hypothetical protein